MRRWTRATRLQFCGTCRAEMHKGDPICLVKVPHVTRELQRCQGCAGSAPPDLPALIEKTFPELTTFTPLMREKPSTRGRLTDMAKEWMPSREPGEDDE